MWMVRVLQQYQQQCSELRLVLERDHQTAMDELLEQHAEAVMAADDKQVKAEADLRDVHAREKQNCATALKHMEAFCAGILSSGEGHDHLITDQDLAGLQKTKDLQSSMDRKHASSITVLRGEQRRRMTLRIQRQESEVQALQAQNRRMELVLEQWRRRRVSSIWRCPFA